jgi:hypothetical protein
VKGDTLTVVDLEEAMETHYITMHGGTTEKKDEYGPEMNLATWWGTCYNCQEKGHRAADCPKPQKPRERITPSKYADKVCNNCGLKGHLEGWCWEKESNAGK